MTTIQVPFWSRIFSDPEEFGDVSNGYKTEFYRTLTMLNKKIIEQGIN